MKVNSAANATLSKQPVPSVHISAPARRWAIIGMGPVGKRLAEALTESGYEVAWYDVDPSVDFQVRRADTVVDAVSNAERVIVAVPAHAASAVARDARPGLTRSAVYQDWASSHPDEKRSLAMQIGANYVDVALLDPVAAAEPMVCIAGLHAATVADELKGIGFATTICGDQPGDAASVKMVRSLFMKPFEALVIELMRRSAAEDPTGYALRSIERTLAAPFGEFAEMLLRTNRVHADRRLSELAEATAMVDGSSGQGLFAESVLYFQALRDAWARPGAPGPDASVEALLAYLAAEPIGTE